MKDCKCWLKVLFLVWVTRVQPIRTNFSNFDDYDWMYPLVEVVWGFGFARVSNHTASTLLSCTARKSPACNHLCTRIGSWEDSDPFRNVQVVLKPQAPFFYIVFYACHGLNLSMKICGDTENTANLLTWYGVEGQSPATDTNSFRICTNHVQTTVIKTYFRWSCLIHRSHSNPNWCWNLHKKSILHYNLKHMQFLTFACCTPTRAHKSPW